MPAAHHIAATWPKARAQHWNNETKERILSARHRRDEASSAGPDERKADPAEAAGQEAVKHESNLLHQIAAKDVLNTASRGRNFCSRSSRAPGGARSFESGGESKGAGQTSSEITRHYETDSARAIGEHLELMLRFSASLGRVLTTLVFF